MINYIVQVVFIQALFLGIYDLFLQKETFFKYNRWYLLGTPIVSFLIPFVQFTSLQYIVPNDVVYQLPKVVLNPQAVIETLEVYQSVNYLGYFFYIGVGVFGFIFAIKLYHILSLLQSSKVVKKKSHSLVLLLENETAFSFFRYIFIHQKLADDNYLQVVQHELVHSKQLHTLDLLVFELLKICMWFNPLTYAFQHRITEVHEYLSDAEVLKHTNKQHYFNNLLAHTFNVENSSFVSSFCKHSLLKKRIIMITKIKSRKMKQLKYLILIPVMFSMLLYVSCDKEVAVQNIVNQAKENQGKLISSGDFHIFIGADFKGALIRAEDMSASEIKFIKKWKGEGSMTNGSEVVLKMSPEGKRVWHFYVDKQYMTNNRSAADDSRKNERDKIANQTEDYLAFSVIEQVPVFPGCEDVEDQKRCLSQKIDAHVKEFFNVSLSKELALQPGIKKIFVMFSIDKEGNVDTVRSRGPHKLLEEEAIRVINLLPKMIPGLQQGKPVGVKYSLPIVFKVV